MKILVVQLLRLGDVLMAAPIVSGLRKKYPKAELHFLGFKDFSQVESLFSESIHWHWIDRTALQDAIRDADRSFFHAQDLLEARLQGIRKEQFDKVYNLTQTKFSGWVCGHIGGRETIGLHYDATGQPRFGSSWFQYLNDHMAMGSGEVFHYVDLFRFACELESETPEWNFRRSDFPVAQFSGRPYILIQPLTSDAKKNYPLDGWRRVLREFRIVCPEYAIGLLAAPFETERVQEAFGDLPDVHVLTTTLAEALHLMDRARLLVTGDTSIKHLANAALVPVVELCLGSSDYRRTGVYKTGSYILHGSTACAPCPHSSPCSQATHACAAQISPEAICLAMTQSVRGGGSTEMIAAEFSPQMRWLETHLTPMGFWMAKDMHSPSAELEMHRCIERSTWKFLLQRQFLNPLAPFGTESMNIRQTLVDRFPADGLLEIRDQLDFLESETAATDRNAAQLLVAMERLLERPLDGQRQADCLETVREFCESEDEVSRGVGHWLTQTRTSGLLSGDGKVVQIGQLRRLQTHLDEIVRRTQVKLKLIRSIKSHFTERL